ncbi:chromosome transmission fidelity protein 18 homolog [Macadamia integrifolia]|uniref:chromosome transmission fidelity protein 18 homolog n=1 Tax=Macadamia integrifolia TaxID=60698 RepID=UPI001C4E8F5D|nr:chromosome transmission fidelity protein 18 homolog [Macadamia integrifolia]
MDMDVPLPEELEWLESNALIQEEEEDYYYPEEEEEVQEQQQQQQQQRKALEPPRTNQPSSSTSTSHIESTSVADLSLDPKNLLNGKKRPRSDNCGSDVLFSGDESSDGKRNRVDPPPDIEIDDEWLQNLQPKENSDSALPVVEEEKFISRFASEIKGAYMPITGPSGDRVYAKMSWAEVNDDFKKLRVQGYGNDLISKPINVLMENVEQEALAKVLQTSSESPNDLILPEVPVVTEQLWVDKYAPNSFTELLSVEQTNREVLLWLKQWDSCVFGSEIRNTTDDVLSALRRHSVRSQNKTYSDMSSFGKKKGFPLSYQTLGHSNNVFKENDKLEGIQELWNKKSRTTSPLEQKVLLLCGSPGLGKTTLAHIAARHCGYRVVEINASDDRSSSTIEAKILDVVQMNSVMADLKPKCLVIDEIDGALGDGKGAVEVILKMVAAEKKYEVGKGNLAQEEKPGKISSKKGRKTTSLSRPVICICNDLFAPALRPLRQVAKVHMFVQPTVSRVVNRLKYICNKEGFRASSIALTALAEYTDCDIRSCLNTLQFLNKKKETLNVLELGSQVVGRKDMTRSVFDVWRGVFQKKNVKHGRKSVNGCISTASDFDSLHSLISNCGDYELTMGGIHENILQLRYHDPRMQKTVKCLDVLGVSDSLHKYIMRTQQMPLYVYQPIVAIAIHNLIAQVEKPIIEWPKSFQRYRTMFMEKKDILRSWNNKISPSISRHLSVECFVEDVVSSLLHILSPPTLRPVALHMLSDREKDDVAQLVDTMVSYSITYKNMKTETLPSTPRHEGALDTLALSFEPPTRDFINFKGYISGHSGLSLAMKQILVHEVEKQKILRESIGGPRYSNEEGNKEDKALLRGESDEAFSTKTYGMASLKSIENGKDKSKYMLSKANSFANSSTSGLNRNATTSTKGTASKNSSTLDLNRNATISTKGTASTASKIRTTSSSSFFDRFRKSASNDSQNSGNALPNPETLERDSRPLLFKFNEGFTNAIKRPVRIRELLI